MNCKRLVALLSKERKQMIREPSNVWIGIILPIIMLIVFGYGLNMDVENIRLGIVRHESSKALSDITACFSGSRYFQVQMLGSSEEADQAIKRRKLDACLFLPSNLERHLLARDADFMIGVNASNPTIARFHAAYIRQILVSALADDYPQPGAGVTLNTRMWFNSVNNCRYYMIPGVIVIIMTIIGCILTALQMAKEYEHGNMESMFSTPMQSSELLLAKLINNYVLGMIGLGISLLFSRYLFHVPLRGSLWVLLLGSSIFLILQMAIGLLISSVTKNQFLAGQYAMVFTFIPVFLLSGFLFEIPNMPQALQYLTYLVPGRYFVDFLQTIFLVGDVWQRLLPNLLTMLLYSIFLLWLSKKMNPKRLTEGVQ